MAPIADAHQDRENRDGILPRVGQLETAQRRLEDRQYHFDRMFDDLTKSLVETERSLRQCFEEGIKEARRTTQKEIDQLRQEILRDLNSLDKHLSSQDSVTNDLVQRMGDVRSAWPTAAIVFVTVATTITMGLVVAWLRHFGF